MHAVRDQAPDFFHEFRFIPMPQIFQHPAVNKIKRKARFYVTAHHPSGDGLIQQIIALFHYILHDESLRIMLSALLTASRFRRVETEYLPLPARTF